MVTRHNEGGVIVMISCDFEDGTRAATAASKGSAELDGKYKRLRRVVAKLAHKAQWHGFQPICIAKSLSAVRRSQRTSDCYEVNRVSVAPRGADAVDSLLRGNGGGGNT